MPRLRFQLLLILALLPQVLAHGPEVATSELRILKTEEGDFLEVALDPPDTEAPFMLTAVATVSGAARLEQRDEEGYLTVARIPIAVGDTSFGPATRYRVRLPGTYRPGEKVPLTLLFSGGALVSSEATVEGGLGRSWFWPAVLLAAFLAALLALSFLGKRWRSAQGLGSTSR